MIKRKTAVAFLFLAGILFLTHAVVLHHHHGNFICYSKSHCEGENPAGNQGSGPDDHHHDNGSCNDHCVLKDPAVVGSTQNPSGLKVFEKKSGQTGSEDLVGSLGSEYAVPPVTLLTCRSLHPETGFVYTAPSSPSSGLRAPPSV